mmetsp:Transcript_35243/g.83576  ORF Transcript_35243/g.83576 Transcript_35243/m.83576 type:complete len:285 (+) Transcript_35243:851-1705(+)
MPGRRPLSPACPGRQQRPLTPAHPRLSRAEQRRASGRRAESSARLLRRPPCRMEHGSQRRCQNSGGSLTGCSPRSSCPAGRRGGLPIYRRRSCWPIRPPGPRCPAACPRAAGPSGRRRPRPSACPRACRHRLRGASCAERHPARRPLPSARSRPARAAQAASASGSRPAPGGHAGTPCGRRAARAPRASRSSPPTCCSAPPSRPSPAANARGRPRGFAAGRRGRAARSPTQRRRRRRRRPGGGAARGCTRPPGPGGGARSTAARPGPGSRGACRTPPSPAAPPS